MEFAKTADDVIIRGYETSDFVHIKELFVDGMRASGVSEAYIEASLSTDFNLASLEDTYLSGRGIIFVMQRLVDSNIIGMVGLQDLSTLAGDQSDRRQVEDRGRDFCQLRRMSIHHSEQRKGRGKQLVQCLILYARDKQFDGITLSTGSWMHHAISFYLSLGFKDAGTVEYTNFGVTRTIAKFEYLLT